MSESTAIVPTNPDGLMVYSATAPDAFEYFEESQADMTSDGSHALQALPQSRIPAAWILTSGSKLVKLPEFKDSVGCFALSGVNPRLLTSSPDGAIVFIPAAGMKLKLLQNPSDAPEDANRVVCGALPSTEKGKVFYKAYTPGGVMSASGKTLVPDVESVPGKKGAEPTLKLVRLKLPEDVVACDDCSKCLRGPARDPKGSDRHFVSDKSQFRQNGDPSGAVVNVEIPEAIRKPGKDDCSVVFRFFGHVYAPETPTMPGMWTPASLTFRSSGYSAGNAMYDLVSKWKAPYFHAVVIGSTAEENAAKQSYRKLKIGGLKMAKKPDGTPVPWPVPGDHAVAAQAAKGNLIQNLQAMSKELADSLTLEDWLGANDAEDTYSAMTVSADDAANMPPADSAF